MVVKVVTIADLAQLEDPRGMTAKALNTLSQRNDIVEFMSMIEGNLPDGNRTALLTGEPEIYERLYNGGVPSSAPTFANIIDGCSIMEARCNSDVDVINSAPDPVAARLQIARPFFSAFAKRFANRLFYGNHAADPRQFTGLSARPQWATIAGSQNVLDGGGTGSDNTSVWLLGIGPETISGLYPRGSKAGLQHRDLGERTVQLAAAGAELELGGEEMQAYTDWFQWKVGLGVFDDRYGVRLCNIDASNLVAESSATDLVKKMSWMIEHLPSTSDCKPCFVGNRTVKKMLRTQVLTKATYTITQEQVFGRSMTMVDGIPFLLCDQLSNAEARIV